ncbi:MAG: zinc finger domain-containing protein, partial [Cyanobacteria bacterium P01_H01_bin.15]
RPQVRPRDLTPSQLETLASNIIDITWQAYKHNGITNDLSAAQTLKTQGYRRAHYRHWVFAREHRPCWRCDAAIAKQMIAGRRLYFCPRCQPA